jgi:molybdate transport system substrate-binding protein
MKKVTCLLATARPDVLAVPRAGSLMGGVDVCLKPNRRQVLGVGAAAVALWLGSARLVGAQTVPSLLVMAGAGYKRPVEALCAAFTQTSGVVVERSYGNLQQIFAQAQASGRVDVLVGDASFIDKAQGLQLPRRIPLGQGILALAWRRNLPVPAGLIGLAGVRQLLAASRWSVAMPNPQQAVYGLAAKQLLQAQGLWDGLQDRLKVVSTVPQVSAYLSSGEVDLGFMNLTEALAVKDQLGGFIQLPSGEGSYTEVAIVAALPDASKAAVALNSIQQFALFLETPAARDILRRAGL